MILIDDFKLVKQPEEHDACITFFPKMFTEKSAFRLVASHMPNPLKREECVTYDYSISNSQSFLPYLFENFDLMRALKTRGVVPSNFNEKNMKMEPGCEVLSIYAKTDIKDSTEPDRYFFYRDRIGIVIGDSPEILSSADTILTILSENKFVLQTRNPWEHNYDIKVFEVEEPVCSGHGNCPNCPNCKCKHDSNETIIS